MKKKVTAVGFLVMIAFSSCNTQSEPAPGAATQSVLQSVNQVESAPEGIAVNARVSASVRINGDACGTPANSANCVKYVRCRKSLPGNDLTNFEEVDKKGKLIGGKRFIINSTAPTIGAAAIIRTGTVWGHLAIVQKMVGTTITLRETNWAGIFVSERSGTAQELNIVGYYR